MKILYLLFAVFLLLFQATSGSVEPPPDTMACRGKGKFCHGGPCPTTFAVTGTCQGGLLNCCSK
ncbi:GLL10 protein, partial [Chaetops frenatus]|nr:GLL10 protein [Chaetops frenatus]